MDLISSATVPKRSCLFQTFRAQATKFGSPSPSLSEVACYRRLSSFMSGGHKIKGLVRLAGCSRQHDGKVITEISGSYLVATSFPEDGDDSDGEDDAARYPSYFESQILNPKTIRNIVKSVIAYYTRRDPRLVRHRVLVRDLPIDPITQVAIEVNIEKDLQFLLEPMRILPVQMPVDPNATIGDFIQDIYEKLRLSISLRNDIFPAKSKLAAEPKLEE